MVNTYLVLETVSPFILTHLLVIIEGSAQLEGYVHSLILFGIPCLKLCMCQKLQQTCKATLLDTILILQAWNVEQSRPFAENHIQSST